MARSFQFPEHPGSHRPNPFVDEQGKNPFAESADEQTDRVPDTGTSGDPGVYQAPALSLDGKGRTYLPQTHGTVIPHRGGRVQMLGWFGAIPTGLAGACLLGSLSYEWMSQAAVMLLMLALVFGFPAWVMGRGDLQVMQSGAMDETGRRSTLIGVYLGIFSTLVSLLSVAFLAVKLVLIALRS